MITTTVLTLHLAQAIGLYLILFGLSALVAPQRWALIMEGLAASPALVLITGVFTFALGVTLAFVHASLADPLAILVTLVGWIALVEGALLIVVPHLLIAIGRWSLRFTRAWAVVSLILGLALGYAGLAGTAGYPHIV